MKKIKTICTIGPRSRSPEIILGLIKTGADALRINLSHTPPAQAKKMIVQIRSLSKRIPIIIDTQGKETRIGASRQKAVLLKKNAEIVVAHTLSPQARKSDAVLFISRADVLLSLKTGHTIFVDDNNIQLQVLRSEPDTLVLKCMVIQGGPIGAAKNIRLENEFEPKTALTIADKSVIAFAKKFPPCEVALSYVADASDVQEARKFIGPRIPITSKIETLKSLKNLMAIVKASDALSIDRNDLGTNVGAENIPRIQKNVIALCRRLQKPVFVATHFLETMVSNNKPTRGEINDIYNTALDGASGIILSSETAVGKDPVHILKTLRTILSLTRA